MSRFHAPANRTRSRALGHLSNDAGSVFACKRYRVLSPEPPAPKAGALPLSYINSYRKARYRLHRRLLSDDIQRLPSLSLAGTRACFPTTDDPSA